MPTAAPYDPRPIGVFDSGLGGLTVLRALIDRLILDIAVGEGRGGRHPLSRDELRVLCPEVRR